MTATDAGQIARSEAFKLVFRGHPGAVSLITAMTDAGPVGLTASSLASVAADPPALSFSVTRSTGSAGGILSADTFVVHLLADSQVETARAFARSGEPRFTPEQGWSSLDTGEPLLADARAALRCRPLQTVPVGDSSLVIAEVLDIVHGRDADPLLYLDRRFHRMDRSSPAL